VPLDGGLTAAMLAEVRRGGGGEVGGLARGRLVGVGARLATGMLCGVGRDASVLGDGARRIVCEPSASGVASLRAASLRAAPPGAVDVLVRSGVRVRGIAGGCARGAPAERGTPVSSGPLDGARHAGGRGAGSGEAVTARAPRGLEPTVGPRGTKTSRPVRACE